MKIVKLEDLKGTEREVHCPTPDRCTSFRLLLKEDGMGFSFHYTLVPKGKVEHWCYKEHLEACFCIAGFGFLTELITKEVHAISVGTLYALDKHDDHTFQAIEDTVLISVFNPPIIGRETHDSNGSYKGEKS